MDVLRGFAAILVALFHYTTINRSEFNNLDFNSKYDIWFGEYGVHFFFIISGFVIFMSLENTKSPILFLKNRFIRLYPAYWICLILTFCVINSVGLTANRETSWLEGLVGLTMFQGFVPMNNVDPSYWSLRPELIFYFTMFFIFWSKLSSKINLIILLALPLILLDFYYPLPIFISRMLNLKWLPLFFSGILFYQIYLDKVKNKWNKHALLFLLLITSVITFYKQLEAVYIILAIYLVFYLFIYDKLNFLVIKPLLFLGKISYPLYLIHQNMGLLLIKHISLNFRFLPSIAIIFFVLLIIIILSYIISIGEVALGKFLRKKII